MLENPVYLNVLQRAVTIVECGQSAGNLRKQRVLRDYTPDTSDVRGEEIVPSAWRHAGVVVEECRRPLSEMAE